MPRYSHTDNGIVGSWNTVVIIPMNSNLVILIEIYNKIRNLIILLEMNSNLVFQYCNYKGAYFILFIIQIIYNYHYVQSIIHFSCIFCKIYSSDKRIRHFKNFKYFYLLINILTLQSDCYKFVAKFSCIRFII